MVVQESRVQQEGEHSCTRNEKKHRLKQRFDVIKKLGQGTYGKVQLAINKETGQEVAIKTIKKVKIESEQDLIRIRREIQIMSSIQHPHIIHIYEVFENKDKIVLVMQYASGGELYDYLSEKKCLDDLEARRIFRQIAAAVYYCHKNKICHRDLKLENILLDEKGNAKIADFGLSNVYDERHLLNTFCGSPLYASPEIVKGVPYYGPEVDCWSMGVLLYTLVYGAMPFDGSNFKRLVKQISEGDYFEPKKKSDASDLIHHLLTVNPSKRSTIVDMCVDWWVNQGYDNCLLQVAEDMANLTPVRIDLLLALSPVSPPPPCDLQENPLESETPKEEDEIPLGGLYPEEEEEEDMQGNEVNNQDTATNSFAFVRGSVASQLSASSPNLQNYEDQQEEEEDDDEDEFLPAELADLEAQRTKRSAERSFDGNISRISSLCHKSKRSRKSDSDSTIKPSDSAKGNISEKVDTTPEDTIKMKSEILSTDTDMHNDKVLEKSQGSDITVTNTEEECQENQTAEEGSLISSPLSEKQAVLEKDTLTTSKTNEINSEENNTEHKVQEENSTSILSNDSIKDVDADKNVCEENLPSSSKDVEVRRKGSFAKTKETFEDKIHMEKKASPTGRRPGKITIPKFLDSPQPSPSPKPFTANKVVSPFKEPAKQQSNEALNKRRDSSDRSKILSSSKDDGEKTQIVENVNLDSIINKENEADINEQKVIESDDKEKKFAAKGILKKGIAKAKLLEKHLSQQNSLDSDAGSTTPSNVDETLPSSTISSPDVATGPSFFKKPAPYVKEADQTVQSKAEIILSSTDKVSKEESEKNAGIISTEENESIWGTPLTPPSEPPNTKMLKNKHVDWNILSSTLDSEMNNWKQQMEESLRRLSPEHEDKHNSSHQTSLSRINEDLSPVGPAPIARSYKKFTFTKDGACITETKKIYTTPRADGSWTRVEKKTKITTHPGINEDFEKLQKAHFRNDSPISRSDSQSSSGSNGIIDDIFDSWTGDSSFCNSSKMKQVFDKFARDPFLRRERRRNPFRQFSRRDSNKSDDSTRCEWRRKQSYSTDRESSDNDDFEMHFDDSHPVIYGSQGLWQFLRSASRGFPTHARSFRDPFKMDAFSRCSNQEQHDSKVEHKRCDSRASSGYGTTTRSLSRERTQSPRETILRFVIDSPQRRGSLKIEEPPTASTVHEIWPKKTTVHHNYHRRDSGLSDGYDSEYSTSHTISGLPSKSEEAAHHSSVYGTIRPKVFHQYVKSFSKEMSSPPSSPPSTASRQNSQDDKVLNKQVENLADSKRHRVEQWLHMSDVGSSDFFSDFITDKEQIEPSLAKSGISPASSIYGTIRPKGFMKYNRSISEKLVDSGFENASLQENQRSQSTQGIERHIPITYEETSDHSSGKVKSSMYRTVSEESNKHTPTRHCSGSNQSSSSSSSPVHQINFTITDGRSSSSQQQSHGPTRYVRSFSGNLTGSPFSRNSSGSMIMEQVIPTGPQGHPVLQMRVSFNRGASNSGDSQVIRVTSQSPQQQTSTGSIWQQREHIITSGSGLSAESRSESPTVTLQGGRNTSLQTSHYTRSSGETRNSPTPVSSQTQHEQLRNPSTIRYEVHGSTQDHDGGHSRGKTSPVNFIFPGDYNPTIACSKFCMDTNRSETSCSKPATNAGVCPKKLAEELRALQAKGKKILEETCEEPLDTTPDGILTPDSLEAVITSAEMYFDSLQRTHDKRKMPKNEYSGSQNNIKNNNSLLSNDCQSFVKPYGVLWDGYNHSIRYNSTELNVSPFEEKSGKNLCNQDFSTIDSGEFSKSSSFEYLKGTSPNSELTPNNKDVKDSGDNWIHRAEKRAMHLLDEMLSDDKLDYFSSQRDNLNSSESLSTALHREYGRCSPFSGFKEASFKQLGQNDHSIFNDFDERNFGQRFYPKLPSIMDDLKSPHEVLRQAMKLCNSLDTST